MNASGADSSLALTGSVEVKALNITGDAALTLKVDDLAKLTTIDGSAATGDLTLGVLHVTTVDVHTGSGNDVFTIAADTKATVDTGPGDDTIIASAEGGTFAGGAGNDTFDVRAALSGATVAKDMLISTVTDFSAGDTLKMIGAATASTELTLNDTVQDLVSALTLATANKDTTVWFQYAGDTYIVANDNTDTLGAGDLAVKLTGTGYNFDGATFSNGELHLA